MPPTVIEMQFGTDAGFLQCLKHQHAVLRAYRIIIGMGEKQTFTLSSKLKKRDGTGFTELLHCT